jgi:hypothetical protein
MLSSAISFLSNFNFNLLQREACIIIQFADSVPRQENISMCLSDTTRQTAPPPPPARRHTRDHNSPDEVLVVETARGTEDQSTWLYIAQGRAAAHAHTHN